MPRKNGRAEASAHADAEQQAFFDLEYSKWEEAVDMYDEGLGPLTQQTIPTLLAESGYLQRIGALSGHVEGEAKEKKKTARSTRLLDVATGPGYVLREAMSQLAAVDCRTIEEVRDWSGAFVGLDFSPNMLTAAEYRLLEDWHVAEIVDPAAEAVGARRCQLVQGDAQALPAGWGGAFLYPQSSRKAGGWRWEANPGVSTQS